MFRKQQSGFYAALLLALASAPLSAASFVYEGQLDDRGAPANGRYDIQLAVYRDAELGATLAAPMVFNAVEVREGRFRLDFDVNVDDGESAWVELAVRDIGAGDFSAIRGRTKATQAPAAIGACWSTVGDSGSNPATHFLGTTDAQPLVLRTANVQSLRIEPSAELFGGVPITANVVAGSSANNVIDRVRGATISGGGLPFGASDPDFTGEAPNRVTDAFGTVGGGYGNEAGDGTGTLIDRAFATVGGGVHNRARGYGGTVSGGSENVADWLGFVGGGEFNAAAGPHGAIGGGVNNYAGSNGAVSGGWVNAALGAYSSINGGRLNCAGGEKSWAGGNRAKVRPAQASVHNGCVGVPASGDSDGDEGSYVWADSTEANFTSSGPDQYLVRAEGGVGLNAAPLDPGVELTISADALGLDISNIWLQQNSSSHNGVLVSAGNGSGTNNAGLYIDHYNGTAQARRMALETDGSVLIRSNVTQANTGVSMAAGAGAWSTLSDRSVKTAVAAIDPVQVLDRLAAMPLGSWSYLAQGESIRHIGPMAQDFAAAFGFGENDTTISTVDADGVALAAIQGLNSKLESENALLRADNQAIRQELSELRALIESQRPEDR